MEFKPDYSTYTYNELIDVINNINREKHPDRYDEISLLLSNSNHTPIKAEDQQQPKPHTQSLWMAIIQGPTDIEKSKQIIKVTVFVIIIVALTTASFAISSFFYTSEDSKLNYFLDPYLFIDSALLLFLTFYLYKHKLWAIVCLIILEVSGWIITYIDLDKFPGGIAILKLLLFISAYKSIQLINEANNKLGEQNA
jgi:hypothetical protein